MDETPAPGSDSPRPSPEVCRRVLSYLRPYRRQFLGALGSMVIYGATDGAVPYLLKRILDDVFDSQNSRMLYYLVLIIVGFALVRGIFGFFQRYLSAAVGLGVVKDLRNEISQKLLTLSSSFFQQHSTGNLISRVTNDTLLVRAALTDAAAALLRDSVRVVALLAVALYLDPVLALIAFVGLPLGLLPVIRFGKKIRRLSRAGQDYFGGLTGLLQETIVGHRVVQTFLREPYEQQRFAEENERSTEAFLRAEKYGALSGPTNEILGTLAIAGVILYGGASVISGVRTQGDFIAFISAMFLLYDPVKKMSRVNTILQAGMVAADRIFEILDSTPAIHDARGAVPLAVSEPRIEYQHVSFAYHSLNGDGAVADLPPRWAVRDVSFSILPGEMVALVGMSGGGKTTLVNLLPRFYDPQEGTITIGGVDIRQATLRSLRSAISIVDQHTFLFNDTVLHNIAYGRLNATESEVMAAARAANADTFIAQLPEGYHTRIGEQGLRLSGGQRARIAIARALLKDAPILILDEATASLDSESEELVQDAIDRLMEGRTVLVIAHRLATVRKAHRIAVIVGGKIVEVGTHEALLKDNGEYAKLYRLQFRDEGEELLRAQAPGGG